jgi:hypothetical protein
MSWELCYVTKQLSPFLGLHGIVSAVERGLQPLQVDYPPHAKTNQTKNTTIMTINKPTTTNKKPMTKKKKKQTKNNLQSPTL